MAIEARAMKEIHDVRLKLYEETKELNTAQRLEQAQKSVEEFEAKFGALRRPGDLSERKVV